MCFTFLAENSSYTRKSRDGNNFECAYEKVLNSRNKAAEKSSNIKNLLQMSFSSIGS